ncbi:hypothetical protein ASD15_24360 [Massilia sp. Root351]|jgi:hypothetical protein|uniref:hypothetical protein n=1 Tax=Massilia sp. Root351 TaxID=1736522 RepID=UPI0007097A16|nr:hypothetical protein [Massilia sp. Root351]KQV89843.1 hypothetical protein ASD15_24360 [Massilia sp. Root351]
MLTPLPSACPPAPLCAPLALVAHDAGAANHLLAWYDAGLLGPAHRVRPCLAGPALALWGGRGPVLELAQALDGACAVLSGTGWASSLEHEARRAARARGLPSVAVLDHWTNYPQRFARGAEPVLPDALWVSDAHARALAEASFPGVPVAELPNLYLQQQADRIGAPPVAGAGAPARVLYVLEPLRDSWGALPQPGELLALDFFAEHLALLGLQGAALRLRPHPSDPPGKYDAWLLRHAALGATLDSSASLAEALAWADTVAGCQTYAMVVALAAGRRVVSSVPPWAPPCVLPHPAILHLSALLPHAAPPRALST